MLPVIALVLVIVILVSCVITLLLHMAALPIVLAIICVVALLFVVDIIQNDSNRK